MDFEVAYTPQQQRFREEVRAFLDSNIPAILRTTHARDGDTYEEFLAQRELGQVHCRKLTFTSCSAASGASKN